MARVLPAGLHVVGLFLRSQYGDDSRAERLPGLVSQVQSVDSACCCTLVANSRTGRSLARLVSGSGSAPVRGRSSGPPSADGVLAQGRPTPLDVKTGERGLRCFAAPVELARLQMAMSARRAAQLAEATRAGAPALGRALEEAAGALLTKAAIEVDGAPVGPATRVGTLNRPATGAAARGAAPRGVHFARLAPCSDGAAAPSASLRAAAFSGYWGAGAAAEGPRRRSSAQAALRGTLWCVAVAGEDASVGDVGAALARDAAAMLRRAAEEAGERALGAWSGTLALGARVLLPFSGDAATPPAALYVKPGTGAAAAVEEACAKLGYGDAAEALAAAWVPGRGTGEEHVAGAVAPRGEREAAEDADSLEESNPYAASGGGDAAAKDGAAKEADEGAGWEASFSVAAAGGEANCGAGGAGSAEEVGHAGLVSRATAAPAAVTAEEQPAEAHPPAAGSASSTDVASKGGASQPAKGGSEGMLLIGGGAALVVVMVVLLFLRAQA